MPKPIAKTLGLDQGVSSASSLPGWYIIILQCLFLVGGLEHEFDFPIQLGMSSSQLTKSYFSRWVGQPPSSFC